MGHRIMGVLLGLGLAGPVTAQDLIFDLNATFSCLDEAIGLPEKHLCIGASAGACMEATPGGSSTAGMSGCMDRELRYWDETLNKVYRELRAIEQQEDTEQAGFPGAVSQADALRDMQRAWIGFRDASCDYERAQWGGGTGGGPATVGCLLQMTGEQTLYLEDFLTPY